MAARRLPSDCREVEAAADHEPGPAPLLRLPLIRSHREPTRQKDAGAYADTGGWGYARWLGIDQTPFGDNADFDQACFACHQPVANRDYVFTTPIALP